MTFKIVGERHLAAGKFLNLRLIDYLDDNGNPRTWEAAGRVNSQGAVLLIPRFEPDGGVLLIRQFRAPTGGYVIEFPAGLIDPGETPASTAVRELYEETGYRGRIDRIGTPSYSSPGLSGEQIIPVWMTIDRRQYPEPPESHPESTESIEVFPLYPDEIAPFLDAAIARGDGIDTKVLLLYRNGDHGI